MNHFNICFVHLQTNCRELTALHTRTQIHSWDYILRWLCFLIPKYQKRF